MQTPILNVVSNTITVLSYLRLQLYCNINITKFLNVFVFIISNLVKI